MVPRSARPRQAAEPRVDQAKKVEIDLTVGGGRVAEMNRGAAATGTFAAAKSLDGPHGCDTGLWRRHFGDGPLPFRRDAVAIVTAAVDALFGKLRRPILLDRKRIVRSDHQPIPADLGSEIF